MRSITAKDNISSVSILPSLCIENITATAAPHDYLKSSGVKKESLIDKKGSAAVRIKELTNAPARARLHTRVQGASASDIPRKLAQKSPKRRVKIVLQSRFDDWLEIIYGQKKVSSTPPKSVEAQMIQNIIARSRRVNMIRPKHLPPLYLATIEEIKRLDGLLQNHALPLFKNSPPQYQPPFNLGGGRAMGTTTTPLFPNSAPAAATTTSYSLPYSLTQEHPPRSYYDSSYQSPSSSPRLEEWERRSFMVPQLAKIPPWEDLSVLIKGSELTRRVYSLCMMTDDMILAQSNDHSEYSKAIIDLGETFTNFLELRQSIQTRLEYVKSPSDLGPHLDEVYQDCTTLLQSAKVLIERVIFCDRKYNSDFAQRSKAKLNSIGELMIETVMDMSRRLKVWKYDELKISDLMKLSSNIISSISQESNYIDYLQKFVDRMTQSTNWLEECFAHTISEGFERYLQTRLNVSKDQILSIDPERIDKDLMQIGQYVIGSIKGNVTLPYSNLIAGFTDYRDDVERMEDREKFIKVMTSGFRGQDLGAEVFYDLKNPVEFYNIISSFLYTVQRNIRFMTLAEAEAAGGALAPAAAEASASTAGENEIELDLDATPSTTASASGSGKYVMTASAEAGASASAGASAGASASNPLYDELKCLTFTVGSAFDKFLEIEMREQSDMGRALRSDLPFLEYCLEFHGLGPALYNLAILLSSGDETTVTPHLDNFLKLRDSVDYRIIDTEYNEDGAADESIIYEDHLRRESDDTSDDDHHDEQETRRAEKLSQQREVEVDQPRGDQSCEDSRHDETLNPDDCLNVHSTTPTYSTLSRTRAEVYRLLMNFCVGAKSIRLENLPVIAERLRDLQDDGCLDSLKLELAIVLGDGVKDLKRIPELIRQIIQTEDLKEFINQLGGGGDRRGAAATAADGIVGRLRSVALVYRDYSPRAGDAQNARHLLRAQRFVAKWLAGLIEEHHGDYEIVERLRDFENLHSIPQFLEILHQWEDLPIDAEDRSFDQDLFRSFRWITQNMLKLNN